MSNDLKFFAGIGLVTLAILVGAIFFFSQPTTHTTQNAKKADASLLIRDDSYKIASSSGKAVLVEFADFQCPACGSYYPVLKQLIDETKTDLTFVFRNFPLDQHQNARLAASVAEAAGKQSKFWPMYDLLFENQNKWSESNSATSIFTDYAKTLGLNVDTFKKDLADQKIKDKIYRDISDGNQLGVVSTPTFFLNGEKLENPASYDDFKTLVKAAILKAPISQAPTEKYHVHANFNVRINGVLRDFSGSQYQSPEGKELDKYIHLHDGVGDLIHIHKKGESLNDFFKSLKISFTKDCIILGPSSQYCSGNGETLKFYVNGKPNNLFEKYEPVDLDRILISFGYEDDADIQKQIAQVSDNACIYSLKCPERGKPPTENCVGGLGSDCDQVSPTSGK